MEQIGQNGFEEWNFAAVDDSLNMTFSSSERIRISSILFHPMLAFNSRRVPFERIFRAFFTLEGGRAVKEISRILDKCENEYRTIDAANKVKYHAAACSSNFAVR